jgi:hypothetical protein
MPSHPPSFPHPLIASTFCFEMPSFRIGCAVLS